MTTLLSERRDLALAAAGVELRAPAKDKPEKFYGLALPYSVRAPIGDPKTWGFFEEFVPGSGTKTLAEDDQRKLIDHDSYYIVSRRSAGDLLLAQSKRGLEVESELDEELSYVRDLKVNIRKKRITGMSIGFRVPSGGDEWLSIEVEETRPDGKIQVYQAELRRVHEYELEEASSVTWPAFVDTQATIRHAIGPALVGRGDAKAISRRAQHHPELAELLKLVDRRSHPIAVQGLGSRRTGRLARRDFDESQPRDGKGRWTDGTIFTRALTFGGKTLNLGGLGSSRTSIALGDGHRTPLEDGDVRELRSQFFAAERMNVGDVHVVSRYQEQADGSVYARSLLTIEKVADAPEMGDDEEDTYMLARFLLRPVPGDDPSYEEMTAADGVEVTHEQMTDKIIDALEQLELAERVDIGNGTVDMYVDGRKLVLKPDGGTELSFNAKGFRALHKAIYDVNNDFEDYDDDLPNGPLSADQTATRTFTSTLGTVTVSQPGPTGDLTIDVPDHDTKIVVNGAKRDDFTSQLSYMGHGTGTLRSARRPGSRRDRRPGGGKRTDRWAKAMARRNFDPSQPRDDDGKWTSGLGTLKEALEAFVGEGNMHEGQAIGTYLDNRDGVAEGRYFDWSSGRPGPDRTFEVGDTESGAIQLDMSMDDLKELHDGLALELLAQDLEVHGMAPLDPADRQSVLLHSMLANHSQSVYFDDGRDFDFSDTGDSGESILLQVADSEGDSRAVELSIDELAVLHASLALTLLQASESGQRSARRPFAVRIRHGTKKRHTSKPPVSLSIQDIDRIMRSYQKRFPHLV